MDLILESGIDMEEALNVTNVAVPQTRSGFVPIHQHPLRKRGRVAGDTNAHSRQWTGLAMALRAEGVNWRHELADAIKAKDRELMNFWMRMTPYLVTGGRKHVEGKGRRKKVTKAALEALNRLENR